MDIDTSTYRGRNKYVIDVSSLGLCLVVVLSFLLHLFTTAFSGYAYAILLACFTLVSILSKRMLLKIRNSLAKIWLLMVMVLVISFLRSRQANGPLLDVIIFTCGFLLILFHSSNENVYERCIKVIKFMAIFFAMGILLQVLLPPVYRLTIEVFPAAYKASLLSGESSGFTTNSGFSAGYIISGFLAVLSQRSFTGRIRLRDVAVSVLLLVALLMTGKRGPTLFLLLTIVYCYLSPVKGSRKVMRYWRMFLVVFLAVILIWAFRDVISVIPIAGRFLNTFAGFLDGEDVTSGRMRLYVWALELFRRKPIMGIGWGDYRTTVIGNVTLATELETHNIYLQLLAETGLIGFTVFVTTFFLFWNTTRIAYSERYQKREVGSLGWQKLLSFSLAYQTYFLLYGLTGNPLYDPHFELIYIFSCLIVIAYKSAEKKKLIV